MGSWIQCKCGAAVHTNPFAGAPVYWLIRDNDYETVFEDDNGVTKAAGLFREKGIPVYRCSGCNRLIVEWEGQGTPVSYLPEGGVSPKAPGVIGRLLNRFSLFLFFAGFILFLTHPSSAGPNNEDRLRTAWEAERKGDLDDAIAGFSSVLLSEETTPDDRVSALNGRGIAHRLKGNYDDAIADYSRAIKLKDDFAAAFSNRGLAYAKSGRYREAIPDFNRAVALDPNNPMTWLKRGNAYFDMGDIDTAIKDWSRAIEFDPTLMRAYYNRCDAYDRIGRTALALKDCEKVIELEPGFQPAARALDWLKGPRTESRPCFCNY
jgi:tetratricopeptide (TPR) repeat protein